METQLNRSLSLLLVYFFIFGTNNVGASNSKVEGAQKSETKASRCSYTVIVPQQKLTGVLCLNKAWPNNSETVTLRAQLSQQQEKLRVHLEQEEERTREISTLQQESITMDARITQLHAQMQNEILHKQEQAVDQKRMEELLVNTTLQVLQLSSSYRDLERKFEGLVSLVNNQSQNIMHMEKQYQESVVTKERQEASSSAGNQFDRLQNKSSESGVALSNVQRDQSSSLNQKLQETQEILPTSSSLPTEAPLISYPATKTPGPWRDCQHVLDSGESMSGIYLLRPRNSNRLFQAWCEQSLVQGGWTVIQRRLDGSVNFFRTWDQYKQGFGNLDGEYWLGLESLFWLTSQASYKLRVLLEDWQGRQTFAEYDSFHVEPETDWYRLRLGTYQGTAGDSLSWHNNKAFTTLDRDKDAYSGNCAHYQKGGWWYHMCAHSNLNGVWYRGGHYRSRYQDGVYWTELHGGSYSLKRVTMMIKPI